MKVTRAGYYAWKSRGCPKHGNNDCALAKQIIDIHKESRAIYGAPRILTMFKRCGVRTSKRRVAGIMGEYDIRGVNRAKRYRKKSMVPEIGSADDLVKRDLARLRRTDFGLRASPM